MTRDRVDPGVGSYLRRFGPVILLYVVLVCATPLLIRRTSAPGALLWAIIGLAAGAAAGVLLVHRGGQA